VKIALCINSLKDRIKQLEKENANLYNRCLEYDEYDEVGKYIGTISTINNIIIIETKK
jgi:hypothetical protein